MQWSSLFAILEPSAVPSRLASLGVVLELEDSWPLGVDTGFLVGVDDTKAETSESRVSEIVARSDVCIARTDCMSSVGWSRTSLA